MRHQLPKKSHMNLITSIKNHHLPPIVEPILSREVVKVWPLKTIVIYPPLPFRFLQNCDDFFNWRV